MRPMRTVLATAGILLATTTWTVGAPFIRGDSNQDGAVDLSDAVATLGFLFVGAAAPTCLDAADADDTGAIDLTDAVYTLIWLFQGGSAPPPPHDECGQDPTEDALDCAESPHCVECSGQEELDAILAEEVPPEVCVPVDAAALELAGFEITVCPADRASPCGETGDPGCPVRLTAVDGVLDVPGREVRVRVEGQVDALPIVIVDPLFGSETVCENDIVFAGDAIVPFTTRSAGPGLLEVIAVGDPVFEDVELSLESSPGLVCGVLESQVDSFRDEIIAELDAATEELLVALEERLVGEVLCDE